MIPGTRRQAYRPRSFPAPYLDIAVSLDGAHGGHLAGVLYGSALMRQARFLAYGAIGCGHGDEIAERFHAADCSLLGETTSQVLGHALLTSRAKRIVEAVTGAPVPPGFMGILARLGMDPISPDPDIYRVLYDLYADPRHRRRVKVLQQTSGQIMATRIRAVATIDSALVRKAVIDRIYDHNNSIGALGRLIGLIRAQCGASDDEIAASFDALPNASAFEGMKKWADRWLLRQRETHNAPPFPYDDPDLVLRLGAGLRDLGQRHHNCAKTLMTDGFTGSRLVYEWVGSGGPATIEMVPAELAGKSAWICEDVRSPRNRDPSEEAVAAIRAKLDRFGYPYRVRTTSSAERRGLVHLLEPWEESGLPRAAGQPINEHEDGRLSLVR